MCTLLVGVALHFTVSFSPVAILSPLGFWGIVILQKQRLEVEHCCHLKCSSGWYAAAQRGISLNRSCAHEVLCLRTDWALVDPLHLCPGLPVPETTRPRTPRRRRRPSQPSHPSTPTASSTRARLRRPPRAAYRSPPRIRSRRGSSCIRTAAPSPRRQATLSSTRRWTSSPGARLSGSVACLLTLVRAAPWSWSRGPGKGPTPGRAAEGAQ